MSYATLATKREFIEGKIIVGIDPAKKKHQAKILAPNGIELGKTFSFPHSYKGFHEILWKRLKKNLGKHDLGNVVFAVETSCDLWQNLTFHLDANGFTVLLVSPLTTYHARVMPDHDFSRTDPKDALVVASSARSGYFHFYEQLDEEVSARRTLSITYDKLRKDLNRNLQRVGSFVGRYFPEFLQILNLGTDTARYLLSRYYLPHHFIQMDVEKEGRVIARISRSQHGTETLMRLQELAGKSIGIPRTSEEEVADRLTLNSWLAMIDGLKEQMKVIDKQLIQMARKTPAFSVLTSLRGVSDTTAALFIAETNDLAGYNHYKQIEKLAGLNLTLRQSGQYKGARRISHLGNRRLSWIIYTMTKETAKYIPEVRIKYLKRQLKKPNYTKNVIASTSPLLQLMLALLKENRPYEYRKESVVVASRLSAEYAKAKARRSKRVAMVA
jgi:transposase